MATNPFDPTARSTSGRPMNTLLAKAEETPATVAVRWLVPKTREARTCPTVQVTATPAK